MSQDFRESASKGPQNDSMFTGYRAWSAEGARVGLVTCRKCGVAVLIDPSDEEDPTEVHKRWHLWHDTSPGSERLA